MEERIAYVIMTRRVSAMGGAQLFALRRALHLREKGYEVFIVVTRHEAFFPLENKFQGIPLIHMPQMEHGTAFVTPLRQSKMLAELYHNLGDVKEIRIETHTLSTIEWGEIFSAQYGAKHLAYPLAEATVSHYALQPGKRIFHEKLESGEFYGCNSRSLAQIFRNEEVPSNYVNIGYDENELSDRSSPEITYKKKKGDYVITTVSRLDKTYIEPLADAVSKLASTYPSHYFVLLIAGGCSDKGRETFLRNNYNNERYGLPNLDIRYAGYIVKLGRDLFRLTDVFVGMGTASINAISQGCITINIDPRNDMKCASGIFGIDTNNFAYAENGRTYSIYDKLREVYLFDEDEKNRVSSLSRELYEDEFEIEKCFERMDTIIESFSNVHNRRSLRTPLFYRLMARTYLFYIRVVRKNKQWF